MPDRSSLGASVIAFLAGLSLLTAGCSQQRVRAASPATAPLPPNAERPMNIAPDTNATPPETPTPQPPAVASSSSPPVEIVAAAPAAPQKPGSESTEAVSQPSAHPAAPQISPQISPGDQATYERKTNDDVSVTQRNLDQTRGKQLSAAQLDLIEKIRSFVSQSRDASKGGDWVRAQNLAQKARLLSAELISSL
jgi:hypothetical protein